MSFLGWIELYDIAYMIDGRDGHFQVNEYTGGSKVMGNQQLLSLDEFKQFVDELDIDPTLLPHKLEDVLTEGG